METFQARTSLNAKGKARDRVEKRIRQVTKYSISFRKMQKKRNLKFDRIGTTSSVNKNYNGLENLSRLHDLHYYNTMEKTVKDWIK